MTNAVPDSVINRTKTDNLFKSLPFPAIVNAETGIKCLVSREDVMELKLNIGDPKTGKTHKRVLKDDECAPFLGKRLGQEIAGDAFGLDGYTFTINGGSDFCGFPMRKDVDGTSRKKILITSGVGIRNDVKGLRRRKTVAGNTIYQKTAQVNLSIKKHGKTPLEPKVDAPEGEAAAEGAEAPAETKEAKPKKAAKPKKE